MKDYLGYHNTNYTDKLLRDGIKTFNRSLKESPDAYTFTLGDSSVDVMLQSTAKYNERRILSKHGDIAWGDILELDNDKWLVVEKPYFNKIHDKSKIKLCTQSMRFTTLTEGVFEYDRRGNKVWIEEPKEVIVEFPCVVESISELNLKTTTGAQINIPEGDMVLHIQCTDSELIEINNNFELFGDMYRLSGIDKSKIYDDEGILTIVASRTTK